MNASNLHTETSTCLRLYPDEELSQSCWENCIECHLPTRPIEPLDIYVAGDEELCLRCHEEKNSAANDLLPLGGGDHPVKIYYNPELPGSDLVVNPPGPLLFVDENGNFPKIHCSTCHDIKSDKPGLLRISNNGSALCLACHRK